MTFGGKRSAATKVEIAENRIELIGVQKLLNLKYFKKDDYSGVRFFISSFRDSLLLELEYPAKTDSIVFIKYPSRNVGSRKNTTSLYL